MLVRNTRREKGENSKLQPRLEGPYEVVAAFGNHTYWLGRLGQSTVKKECFLKLYQAGTSFRNPGQ